MKTWAIAIAVVMVFALLLACGAPAEPTPAPAPEPVPEPAVPPGDAHLHLNPIEESMPIYGGVLKYGYAIPRSFDAHQKVGYGPTGALPTFNQLVMFDINYKDTALDTIVGDLAESWETSEDGTEITFKLHQGVKWHDGMPFTADDVVYSLDKMTDTNRSAIADYFPAYESVEKIDDYTVKIYLKYASAGFLMALAAGESVIQAKHLAGTDDQSADFMVGTGPFIFDDYVTQVHMKWRRNPAYWKYDQYGNQLPYLDGLYLLVMSNVTCNEMLIGRRLDIKGPVTGSSTVSSYEFLRDGAPELLWQMRTRDFGAALFLNLKHQPLDDIRVRRAIGLVLEEEDLIIGYSGDVMFGNPDVGLLHESFGLPKEEVRQLMGWNKTMVERVAEAQQLMAEAGYPNGFKMNMLSRQGAQTNTGANLVLADALYKYLYIESEVNGLPAIEVAQRLSEGNYDLYSTSLRVGQDPAQIALYFGTDGYANYSNYSNPELDEMMAGLDRIIDPEQRRDAVWEIERLLLTDLPALPTGCHPGNVMPYYPHVRNIRWTNMSYSNINRFEDVWIDESLRVE